MCIATSYEQVENFEDAMFDLTALTIYGGFSNKSIEQVLERVLRKHAVKIVSGKEKKLALPSAATIGSFFNAFVDEALQQMALNTQNGYEQADSLINQAVGAYE
ncbi:Protein TOM71 [Spathaspora sp. JA1]|nr:Protein TOM71 [Spathaspora sp. JA1]